MNDVASLLKQFLVSPSNRCLNNLNSVVTAPQRELPEPLVLADVHAKLIEMAQSGTCSLRIQLSSDHSEQGH